MSAASALGASLMAVLAHPRWWLMSLAAFLVRGGLLVLLLPMVPLPSPAALATALGPTLVGFVFGGVSPSFLLLVGIVVAVVLAWAVVAGLAGAAIDLALVREVAADDDLDDREAPTAGGPWRAFAVRWLAHLPTAVAVAWAAATLVDATYAELISPGDPGLPLVLRVVLRVPLAVALVAVAWAFGEVAGGIAVRRVSWGAGVRRAVLTSITGLLCPAGVAIFLLTSSALIAALGGGGLAIAATFDRVRVVLVDGGSAPDMLVALSLLSAAWIGTAMLVAVAAAWRAAAWTYEEGRRRGPRTIG